MNEAEQKVEQKKPRRKLRQVIVVASEGQSALVQWDDKGIARRCYVPVGEVQNDKCPQDVLDAGLPYGVPWAEFIKDSVTVTPDDAQAALYQDGFWTVADIEARPARAVQIISMLIVSKIHPGKLCKLARAEGG